ncbi:MAG: VIT domain-containing protein [Bacteroidota bacterium]
MKRSWVFIFVLCIFLPFTGMAGGFIIVVPDKHQNPDVIRPPRPDLPNPNLFPLEVRSNQVETKIKGQSANTSIKQVFYNPTNRQLEGYFLFPIPENAVIGKFTMLVNGVETEAEMLDAQKAKKIYEDIVRRAKDPALLEYYNKGLFRVRIFPILPRSEQRISLSYTETLKKEDGTIEYTFPLNTEKYSAKPLNQVSFKIDIDSPQQLKNVFCPTHEVEVNRKTENRATVGYEATQVRSDRDFKLYYSVDDGKVGISMLNYKNPGEEGYFFFSLSPGFDQKTEVVAKDVTFVLDASGSMAGDKMDQAKKALEFCIENLNEQDRFNIVRFSTEATALFEELQSASETNRRRARTYVKELRAIGGTNIEEALDLALSTDKKQGRPQFVIFMTDGKPTIGETSEEALLSEIKTKNTSDTRIFTFGIGTTLNTHLLDKLTAMTQAYRTYVLPDEDIEIKVSNFYQKVASPIMTDIKLHFDKSISVSSVYPKELPDLFKGSNLTLMGRYSGYGEGTITLEGYVNGKKEKINFEVDFERRNESNNFIPPLWAARCVGHLLDQIRLNGENQELVAEVVRLAKKHGIVTPYTSYLIVEDERQLVSNRQIAPQNQLLRNRVMEAPEAVEEDIEESFTDLSKKEGNSGVRASTEVQQLNKADNLAEARTGSSRMEYKDKAGHTQNLAGGIQNIRGRAFYNNANVWIDANVQEVKNQKVNRIQFNSQAYFDLLTNNPEAIDYLALGQNVRFVMNDQIIEIFE